MLIKIKTQTKQTTKKQTKQNKAHFAPPFCPPLQFLFIHLTGLGDCCVSYSILFCLNSFTCKFSLFCVLLVRFKVSGLWYIISAGPLSNCLQGALLLP